MEEEILELIPSLKGRTKKSVRILPQQGEEPFVNATKLGGLFLWSEDEPWFYCDVPEQSLMDDAPMEWSLDYELSVQVWDEKHNDAYLPILQIRAEDIPLMRFPPDTNIFQLFWCPRYHNPDYSPICRIAWRNEESVKKQLNSMPKASFPEPELSLSPSVVFLQEVTEYPDYWALSADEKNLLIEEREEFYWKHLSPHGGIKVGGHPNWIQRPEIPICDCGKEMEHLLTIGGDVFEDYPNHKAPGLHIGRSGSVYVFICYECKNLPFNTVFQGG
jgi:hypothetical protein